MATVLDISLIQSFDIVFPVILVWAVVFALLQKTGVIGSKNALGINAAIASAVSLMILLSRSVIDLINFMLPWFSVAIIFFVMLILIFKTMGLKDATLEKALHDRSVYWSILGISLLIMIVGLGNIFGQGLLEQRENLAAPTVDGGSDSSSFQTNIYEILFHPKVLGMLIMFTIIVFAVALLSG